MSVFSFFHGCSLSWCLKLGPHSAPSVSDQSPTLLSQLWLEGISGALWEDTNQKETKEAFGKAMLGTHSNIGIGILEAGMGERERKAKAVILQTHLTFMISFFPPNS